MDWMLDRSHDLSNSLRQQSLHEQLQSVCFIAAALDCSTKSRAREIPRDFGDGRPPPRPLRSEKHPLGLPELTGSQLTRVEQDNAAASFVLSEIDQLVDRGGGSVRENPYNSLHWWTPDEVAMWESGRWSDQRYSACCFGGAQSKSCSGCATTLRRSPNGPERTATISMIPRNGNLGCRMVSAISPQLRSPSIQQSYVLPSPRQLRGGQCVLATPSSMCRGPHHRAAPDIGTIGLTSIPEHFVSGL